MKYMDYIDAEDVQILVRIHRMREDQIQSLANNSFDMYFEKEKEYVFDGSCPINKAPLKWYQLPLDLSVTLPLNTIRTKCGLQCSKV